MNRPRAHQGAGPKEFLGTLPPEGFTQFRWLGEGGHGTAGVWSKVNEHGTVVDAVAVKDTYMQSVWPLMYWRVQDQDSPLGWVPLEVHVMKTLNSDKIVKLRHHMLFEEKKVARIYMEYCPGGDLNQFFWQRMKELGTDTCPEPFVWYMLECFAEAAMCMLQGGIYIALPGWTQIIHRDLKPENIFLGCRDPYNYPAYPILKTGDLGIARFTGLADDRNPRQLGGGGGTPGWLAPEVQFMSGKTLSPSDVWVYGAICMRAMSMRNVTPGDITFRPDQPRIPRWDEPAVRNSYSHELVNLVKLCVKWDPNARAKTNVLLSTIWRHTRGPGPNFPDPNQQGTWGRENPDLARGMRRLALDAAPEDLKVGDFQISWAELQAQEPAGGDAFDQPLRFAEQEDKAQDEEAEDEEAGDEEAEDEESTRDSGHSKSPGQESAAKRNDTSPLAEAGALEEGKVRESDNDVEDTRRTPRPGRGTPEKRKATPHEGQPTRKMARSSQTPKPI